MRGDPRRSIALNKLPWLEWNNNQGTGLLDLLNRATLLDKKDSEKKYFPITERALYLSVLFCTGCRCSEALTLKPNDFYWNDEIIEADNIRVLKYRKAEGEVRNILIPRLLNKLSNNFLYHIQLAKSNDQTYLLPKRTNFTSEIIPTEHTSPQNIWNKITEIHPILFPHFLRGQCCSFMIDVAGLDPYQVTDWFRWSTVTMSEQYFKVSKKKLADQWHVKEMPKRGAIS